MLRTRPSSCDFGCAMLRLRRSMMRWLPKVLLTIALFIGLEYPSLLTSATKTYTIQNHLVTPLCTNQGLLAPRFGGDTVAWKWALNSSNMAQSSIDWGDERHMLLEISETS